MPLILIGPIGCQVVPNLIIQNIPFKARLWGYQQLKAKEQKNDGLKKAEFNVCIILNTSFAY